MKDYKQFKQELEQQQQDETDLSEGSLRNISAAVLVLRVKSLSTKIQNIKFQSNGTFENNLEAMFQKIDLQAKQQNAVSYLVGQLGVMKR